MKRLFSALIAFWLLAPVSAAAVAADPTLAFSEIYKSVGVLGMQFSDKLLSLKGKRISIKGFMAPPLKAEASFFVLTREPVALCPFCNSDSDWPADILVVYLGSDQEFVQNSQPIEVSGVLEVGPESDPQTGFYSRLRLTSAHYDTL